MQCAYRVDLELQWYYHNILTGCMCHNILQRILEILNKILVTLLKQVISTVVKQMATTYKIVVMHGKGMFGNRYDHKRNSLKSPLKIDCYEFLFSFHFFIYLYHRSTFKMQIIFCWEFVCVPYTIGNRHLHKWDKLFRLRVLWCF